MKIGTILYNHNIWNEGVPARDIRFRAWDKKKKEMFDVMSIDWEDIGQFATDSQNVQHFLSDIVLLQYTGLKDKNGTKIYEGHICKFSQRIKGTTPGICKIVWKHGGFHGQLYKFRYFGDPSDGFVPFAEWAPAYNPEKRFEVIGDIFRNPELLK